MQAFDPKTDWNIKNKECGSRGRWEKSRGGGDAPQIFSHPPRDLFSRSIQHGWLCDLINLFGQRGCFDAVRKCFGGGGVDGDKAASLTEMAALLAAPAVCADMLEEDRVKALLGACAEAAFAAVDAADASELRSKEMSAVSDLLCSLKLLCLQFWPHRVDECDVKRLQIVCKMLKTPQFHSKMTALKEVRGFSRTEVYLNVI